MIIIIFMGFIFESAGGWGRLEGTRISFSFGFLLISAYLLGDILSWAKLPKITGYIIAGVLAGPYVANFIPKETVLELKLLDNLALSFIALSAGGELKLEGLKRCWRSIWLGVLFQVIGVFAGIFCLILFGRNYITFLNDAPLPMLLSVAAMIAVISIARSPSLAMAVISESKAKGPFTETILGVTVIVDVLVITLFAATVSFALNMGQTDASMDILLLTTVGIELSGSFLGGLFIGWVVAFYIERIGTEIPVFILALAFLVTFFSDQFGRFLDEFYDIRFHLEPMLMCLTAGFFIRNFTKNGDFFMERLDRLSLPVYVLFFALIGASLCLAELRQVWMLAILLAASRAFFIWASAWLSQRLSDTPPMFGKMAGLSFVSQACVSIGLAGNLSNNFPDWGAAVAATLVAAISINQVIGPITFKYALDRVGESRRPRS
ncbi:MAG: cation:proton antiporter [Desulfobacterales bacterium]